MNRAWCFDTYDDPRRYVREAEADHVRLSKNGTRRQVCGQGHPGREPWPDPGKQRVFDRPRPKAPGRLYKQAEGRRQGGGRSFRRLVTNGSPDQEGPGGLFGRRRQRPDSKGPGRVFEPVQRRSPTGRRYEERRHGPESLRRDPRQGVRP